MKNQVNAVENEFDDDDVFRYVSMWRDDDNYTALNLFLDKGYVDVAIRYLVEAGAIDSTMCYDHAKPMERHLEQLNENYSNEEYSAANKEALEGVEIWVRETDNEIYFIDKQNHFVTDAELTSWGFKKERTND